jgi:hypothetical protein
MERLARPVSEVDAVVQVFGVLAWELGQDAFTRQFVFVRFLRQIVV